MSFKEEVYESIKDVAIDSGRVICTQEQEVFFRYGLMKGVDVVLEKLKEIGFILE